MGTWTMMHFQTSQSTTMVVQLLGSLATVKNAHENNCDASYANILKHNRRRGCYSYFKSLEMMIWLEGIYLGGHCVAHVLFIQMRVYLIMLWPLYIHS